MYDERGLQSGIQERGTPPPRAPKLQGYLAHKKTSTPLGTPDCSRHRPTVESKGGG